MPAKVSKVATEAGDDSAKLESPNKDKIMSTSIQRQRSNPSSASKNKKSGPIGSSNLRDVINASSSSTSKQAVTTTGTGTAESEQPLRRNQAPPSLNWSSFDRKFLHAYRRQFNLETPPSYANSYRQMVLSQSSMGLRSPTMLRRRETPRQSKEALSLAVRQHFSSLPTNEAQAIAGAILAAKSVSPSKRRIVPEKMPIVEPDIPYPK